MLPLAIYIGDASIVEGNSGTRTMSFTVNLSHPSGLGVSVNYATANGTAKTSDNDYLAASGRLDFAPGETTKTVNVTIRGDTRKEADERFLVKLSGADGATIADGQGGGHDCQRRRRRKVEWKRQPFDFPSTSRRRRDRPLDGLPA